MSELPKGWVETTLGEIGNVQSGIGFPNEFQGKSSGTYPVYKVGDVSRGVVNYNGKLSVASNYVDEDTATLLKGHIFPVGSTLFAKIGEALKLNRRGYVYRNGLADNNVMGYKAEDSVSDRFVYHFLRTQDLASLSRSTTIPSIRKGDVEDVKISLPPTAEQARIADKLDSLLAQVDTLKTRLDALPALIKRFRQSVLAAAVSGKLTEDWRGTKRLEFDWKNGMFSDFFDIQGGTQPPKSTFIDHAREGYVRLVQIRDFGEKPVPTFVPDSKSLKKFVFDDFLIGRYGASVGRICTGMSGAYNVALVKVVALDETCIFKSFLGVLLNAPSFQSAITGFERSAQDGFNKNDLSTIEINIPSVDEQAEIVSRVEQLFAFADQLENRLSDARKQVDNLTQSILAKAFRGELVPKDPSDEPASALLARISAQRAAAPKPKRGRKPAAH